ncbi:MAG: hypothetical protein ACJ74K_12025, partial [Actinomycetes bacterium]
FITLVKGDLLDEEAEQLRTKLFSRFNATSLEELGDAIRWETDRSMAALFAGTYTTALSTAVMAELLRRTNIPLERIEDMDGISHRTAAVLFGGPPSSGRWPPHVFKLSQRLASIFHEDLSLCEVEAELARSATVGMIDGPRCPDRLAGLCAVG